jgi:hypothetical protein
MDGTTKVDRYMIFAQAKDGDEWQRSDAWGFWDGPGARAVAVKAAQAKLKAPFYGGPPPFAVQVRRYRITTVTKTLVTFQQP